MTSKPTVSVVMSVFNGEGALSETMDSVLSQEGVDFEFIVVNDGSTDGSGDILNGYARRDPRVRVLHQENQGLTRALIRACGEARGAYIARQDAGDISLSDRIARQVQLLSCCPEAVLLSCGTRVVGPAGELLYETIQSTKELTNGLTQLTLTQIKGPSHHGSVMFDRAAYTRVGGYRAAFRVAQDLDLWLRLAEIGSCLSLPEILYQASLNHDSISQTRRSQQLSTAQFIIMCAAARRDGRDEAALLREWEATADVAEPQSSKHQSLQGAKFYYFLARVLRKREPSRARSYYWRAFRACFVMDRER